jgi:NADH:ubiquinone oxidoreductase subunit E
MRQGQMNKNQQETSPEGKGRENLLGQLKLAQAEYNHVPGKIMDEVARSLDIPVNEVYSVASFYSFLTVYPHGKNMIRICKSVPCFLKDSKMIVESVKNEIGITSGESTPDGIFSFELTNCIGACDSAPAMLINDDVHGNLTPKKISRILQSYK